MRKPTCIEFKRLSLPPSLFANIKHPGPLLWERTMGLHFIYIDSLTEKVVSISPSLSCKSPESDMLTAKLLAAANQYGLEWPILVCESHLYKDISINSVAEILALVDHYNATKLKDISPRFFFFFLGKTKVYFWLT